MSNTHCDARLNFAFYQEGIRWEDQVAAKNALLFFDGLAFLVPPAEDSEFERGLEWLHTPLREGNLLRVLRPRQLIDTDAALRICEKVIELVIEGAHAVPSDGRMELDLTKLGVHHHPDLVSWVLGELRAKWKAVHVERNDAAVMPTAIARRLLHVVNAEISSEYSCERFALEPVYDSDVSTLHAFRAPASTSGVHALSPIFRDAAALGLDVGHVPIPEIVQFRKENRVLLERYKLHAAFTAIALEHLRDRLGTQHVESAVHDRCLVLRELKEQIEAASESSWRNPARTALDAAAVLKSVATGDVAASAIRILRMAVGDDQPYDALSGAISYLLLAHSRFSS